MKIRPAKTSDAVAISALWRELVTYHRQLDPAMPAAAEDGEQRYAARIMNRLDDPYTRVLVAEQDDQLVGFVLALIIDLLPEMFAPDYGGFVADIFVQEAYRGQGVGQALIRDVERWFMDHGVRHYEWYVAAHNPAGRAFWQSLGGRDVMTRMRVELEG